MQRLMQLQKNKNKKKKKSKASQHNSEDIADDKPQNVAKQAKAEKKKKRGLNEIDQALQELNMKWVNRCWHYSLR